MTTRTDEFAICVDNESLERTRTGTVVGQIWLTLGGFPFPEQGWFDFVVPFLLALKNAVKLVEAGRPSETVEFFQGPFSVTFDRADDGTVEVLARNRGDSRSSVLAVSVALHQVSHATREAAFTILAECRRRGWDSHEIEELAA